ncbi:hypothetical protein [Cupriavidus pauculus]|nr:hypothetical protein [Cupriavidus pauculus]
MNLMRSTAAAVMAFLVATPTWAACFGSQNMYTCNDSSGNSYQVNRMGNVTTMNGYNAQTGSSWNQSSQHYGNSTHTTGTASNGNSWNSTTQNYGNGYTSTYGTDSHGRSFSRQCGPYGCN